jgi:hypothetical protein
MKAHAPSRNAGLICLLLFAIGMLGWFVPMGHLPYLGGVLKLVNHAAIYLLMAGYALLLLAIYIL